MIDTSYIRTFNQWEGREDAARAMLVAWVAVIANFTYTPTPRALVALGAAWLDIIRPGWWNGGITHIISLDLLSMASASACVMGQVFRDAPITADDIGDLGQVMNTDDHVPRWAADYDDWGDEQGWGQGAGSEGYSLFDYLARDWPLPLGARMPPGQLMGFLALFGEATFSELQAEWVRVIEERRAHHGAYAAEVARVLEAEPG